MRVGVIGNRKTHGWSRDGCENCGFHPLTEFRVPGASTMWYCQECELYQRGQYPHPEAYTLPYHDCYARHRGRKLRTAVTRLNRIAALIDCREPRFLDIGCSLGYTVEAAADRRWNAQGVDVSAEAVESCRDRGLNCHLSDGQRLPFDDNTFDVLTAWHVIEHVADVSKTLLEWRRVLKENGVLALETPDASCRKVRLRGAAYRRFWAPEHVYTFRPRNLIPFLSDAGFRVVRKPILGRLGDLPPGLAAYNVGYQLHSYLMWLAGLKKSFQLYCRRVPIEGTTPESRCERRDILSFPEPLRAKAA